MDPQITLLLHILEEAYHRRAWHGPNLAGTLRGLTAAQAAWRPAEGRHNIWEVAVHCAYWKYAVRRRILGLKRGSFALEGSNWFPRLDNLTPARWKSDLQLLGEQHRLLHEAVAALTPQLLKQSHAKGTTRIDRLVYGVAAHDVYHAGQIQLLKRLCEAKQEAQDGTPVSDE